MKITIRLVVSLVLVVALVAAGFSFYQVRAERIRLQVVNHHTGFLVNTPEGAAHRIRYLLHHKERIEAMGKETREFVREHFLLTRHLREYLTLMLVVTRGGKERLLEV